MASSRRRNRRPKSEWRGFSASGIGRRGRSVRVFATAMSRRMMSRGCMVMPLPPHHAIASACEAVLNNTLLVLVACCRALRACGNAAHASAIGHAVLRCAVGVANDASEGRTKESACNGTGNGLSGPVSLCSELLALVQVYEVFVMRLAAGLYVHNGLVGVPIADVLCTRREHEGGG